MPTWAVITLIAWPPVAAVAAVVIAGVIREGDRQQRQERAQLRAPGFKVADAHAAVVLDGRWSR
jgi:hypothetical protein